MSEKGAFASARVTITPGQHARVRLAPRPFVRLSGRVVEYPSGALVADAECGFEVALGIDPGPDHGDARSAGDGSFSLQVPAGELNVVCSDRTERLVRGETQVRLMGEGAATVRMVAVKLDAVFLGVTVEMESRGARVVAVRSHAARAGLRVGDLVTAASGVPLGSLGELAATELAFRMPRGQKASWTVERGDRRLTIDVTP